MELLMKEKLFCLFRSFIHNMSLEILIASSSCLYLETATDFSVISSIDTAIPEIVLLSLYSGVPEK